MTRPITALILSRLLAACSAPQPIESASQTAAGLESTCGWQQTECSPHAAADVALRIYSSGSVGALLVGDDPCATEPRQQLDVPAGAAWASWAKPGDFTIYAEPIE